MERSSAGTGFLCGIGAYGLWGVVPLYFKALARVPALEILTHRIVWSVLLLLGFLWVRGKLNVFFAVFRKSRTMLLLAASTVLIAINWLVYIYAVVTDQVTQASLGYFICPLLNVALGAFVLKESLRPLQKLAIALAASGVAYLTWSQGQLPGIGLGLAFSFSIYGLLRKIAPVDGSVGLTVETLMLAPLSLMMLATWALRGESHFLTVDRSTDALLLAAGAVTTIPLILFTEAARRLRLTTLGFLQYLAPTLQLLLAVAWFHEPFPRYRQIAFAIIWTAIAVFCVDTLRNYLRDRNLDAMEPD